jgi:hypothetical protein
MINRATINHKLKTKYHKPRTTIFFLVLALFCLFSSCENDEEQVRALNDKRVMVEEARNVVTLFSQGGRMNRVEE